MRIRLRGPTGQATLTLAESSTVGDLRSAITDKTSLPHFDLKYGYPPLPLDLGSFASSTQISDIGIKLDGEQLIASRSQSQITEVDSVAPSSQSQRDETKPPPTGRKSSTPSVVSFSGTEKSPSTSKASSTATAPKQNPSAARQSKEMAAQDTPEIPVPSHGATMVLRVVPDDNSCLFRAFNTAFFGISLDSMHELRSVIAQYIQSHPDIYTAAVLDRQVDDYCKWIQREDAWGGSIELDIFSKHFEIEICSIDVQTLRTDRYNEGKPQRCILVYSGIHYDTIALSSSEPPFTNATAPPEFDIKVFDAKDDIILQKAVELCKVLQNQGYYTDTVNMKTICNICRTEVIGERGAQEHAQNTGHVDFGEVPA